MPIVLKSRREIEMMRQAGKVLMPIVAKMKAACTVGTTTRDIDEIAHVEIEKAGATSPIKNYPSNKPNEGFPGWTCISVNEEVVHGIPGPRKLRDGDIVKIDAAIILNGYCADTATTVVVGRISPKIQKLLDVTKQNLDLAIQNIKPDKKWSEVARLIQWNVERHCFSVVPEFVGHGVGRTMHQEPKVPNFITPEHLRGDFRPKISTTITVLLMGAIGN